jgi:SAM-dependent methyltransferase
MTTPNYDEIAYWNSDAGSRWAFYQKQMDRALAPLGARALESAAAGPGDAVLDVGCGCGESSLELAGAIGATGSVLGVDVSQPMLAVAEERAKTAGFGNVRFLRADAATATFSDDAFDLAFSRFGVMFFDDPLGAFANVRRALRPDGRLVFVCWRDLSANPWFAVPAAAIRAYVPQQPRPDPEAPGPLAFADPTRVRGILEGAGFESVEFEAFDAKVSLGPHASALEVLSHIGPAASLLDGVEGSARVDALASLDAALREHERAGDVALDGGVWVVSARCAGSRASSE